jgi:hypothetical protein
MSFCNVLRAGRLPYKLFSYNYHKTRQRMAKLTLSRKGLRQNTWILKGTEWLVGSNPACPVRICDPAILPNHARISRNAGVYRIAAISDDHEIRVNHGHAREHVLRDGDIIHLGGYTLIFSADTLGAAGHTEVTPSRAWLEILNGRHRGRIIHLQNPVTRFGNAGDLTVMISRRTDAYYLSYLEGNELPRINQTTIHDTPWPLNPGDTIHMGRLSFGFFADYDHTPPQGEVTANGQRHCSRVTLHNPAIIVADEARWDTRLMDLSLSGALLEYPNGWRGQTGDSCTLMLQLADQSYLEVDAQVRQVDSDRLGMAFVDLDESERDEIRWLVEINLGDTDLLQRELSEFV